MTTSWKYVFSGAVTITCHVLEAPVSVSFHRFVPLLEVASRTGLPAPSIMPVSPRIWVSARRYSNVQAVPSVEVHFWTPAPPVVFSSVM